LASGSITNNYVAVGGRFDHPIRILFVQNLTDVGLMFSLNGIDDSFVLPDSGYMILDVSANKTTNEGLFFPVGDRIFVKQIGIPSTGSVYVSAFYGKPINNQ
jgi:hypothetical protein